MNLEDFVATTLEQVVRGVQRAQKSVCSLARINPQVEGHPVNTRDYKTGTLLRDVEFDVAVTVTESAKSGANLSVGIPWMKGGVDGGSDSSNSAVSRVRFSLPVAFPKHIQES
ncbi:MAG TPA: hypothetical protein VEB19_00345 [Gemmatimonadaceae bacterium]|nr:hypothetical protein [Gemmatimonadaceae bacterium]